MSTQTLDDSTMDPRYFRDVLGNVPTSVVAITALNDDGCPIGMIVGTFISVSLDPPLVAFLPDKSSSTFPKIQSAGRFCANVLTTDQENVSRALASKNDDKFANLDWEASPDSTPHLLGAAGWIDCTLTDVHDAGDHYIAVGQVENLRAEQGQSPLIFLRGGFGKFASTSLAAPAETELYRRLRVSEAARPALQRLADEIGSECLMSTVVGDQLVLTGNCLPGVREETGQRLGQRMPYSAPIAAPFAAWASDSEVAAWAARGRVDVSQSATRSMLERVRERGWSVVMSNSAQVRFEKAIADMPLSSATPEKVNELREAAAELTDENYEPDDLASMNGRVARYISAPVFENGKPTVLLTIYRPADAVNGEAIENLGEKVAAAAATVTEQLAASSLTETN